MKLISLLLIFPFFSFAQSQADTGFRIIGQNDLVLMKRDLTEIPLQLRSVLPSIGKLNSGCTVSHIGQGFVITAGHCFWQTFFDEELKLNQPCTDETIFWQISGKTSRCLEIIAMQKNSEMVLDFAIMKISNPPIEKVTVEWSMLTQPEDVLTIFSYPLEEPMSWSKFCPLKKVMKTEINPTMMHYVCDTKEGSSGAPVLNAKTGHMVGLHISGDGDYLADGTRTEATENFGIFIYRTPIEVLLLKNGYRLKVSHQVELP